MSLRMKFVLFFITLHFFAAGSTYFHEFIYLEEKYVHESVMQTYEHRKAQYASFIEEETIHLNALAAELSSHKLVLKAYEEDNRTIIIDQFESFWRHMANQALIKEIHFFKKPALSFVNFANVEAYNIDAKEVRRDISWVTSSFQPSTHFLVCRLYPGLRATYPVIKNDTMLGGVSLGIDMSKLADRMQKLFNAEVLFALEEAELHKNLSPDVYDRLKTQGSLKEKFRFFGDGHSFQEAFLEEQVIYHDETCYSIFAIHDFHGKVIGYFVFKDDFSSQVDFFERQSWNTFFYYTAVGLLVFIAIMLLVNRIASTMEHMSSILQAIREKAYDKLALMKRHDDPLRCDEICRFEQQLIDTGYEIRNYLDLLTKELHDYADKMHMDALTRIFNRHAIDDIGENLFLKAQLAKQPLGVMLFDIDNFKVINDTYGHDFGDFVLKQICVIVKNTLRSDDFFARYGGEEFLILLPKTDIAHAFEVGKKVCYEIGHTKMVMGDKSVTVTVSIGLTELHEKDMSLYDLINRADQKLYQAKKNGKNRVEV